MVTGLHAAWIICGGHAQACEWLIHQYGYEWRNQKTFHHGLATAKHGNEGNLDIVRARFSCSRLKYQNPNGFCFYYENSIFTDRFSINDVGVGIFIAQKCFWLRNAIPNSMHLDELYTPYNKWIHRNFLNVYWFRLTKQTGVFLVIRIRLIDKQSQFEPFSFNLLTSFVISDYYSLIQSDLYPFCMPEAK